VRMTFTVMGTPVPKARARVMKGWAFTPARVRDWEKTIANCAAIAKPVDWPMDAEYKVRIAVYRAARRGDVDNYAKSATDACNGVLYGDDRQISDLRVIRFDGDIPRLFVEIEAA
jgi:Holliday junction resolvase RusA-like endonuclease